MWLKLSSCILAASLLLSPTLAAVCPDGCICSTTRDGLHRATCSSLAELYKFTLRQKHHNINILDLSHNNITKLSHELDRLTEVVTLDLSTNGIQDLNKFLLNAKKLVHLNLANNRIHELSSIHLPASVSSLDLTNNNIQNVPSDLGHLADLEHLEMEGNPLDCSCENLVARDRLIIGNVLIDPVVCVSPKELKGKSWLELKTKDVCKVPKTKLNYLDMMMGDQPLDAVQVGEESTALKSMPMVASSDLEDGNVIQGKNVIEDDDSQQFLIVERATASPLNYIEGSGSGSGDGESTTITDYLIERMHQPRLHSNLLQAVEAIPEDNVQTTADPLEGSGEGSGFLPIDYDNTETTTEAFVEYIPGIIERIFDDDTNKSTTEFPLPEPPTVYQGGSNWNVENTPPEVTEKVITSPTPRDSTVSEQIRVTQASEVLSQLPASNETVAPHKTGTYVCIAIIVVLLVGLIGFAIAKGQMRKRRDRRLIRQQKRDVEKASKEMVDMNKSLLGKPAALEEPIERKANGKYELVPTHEVNQKKGGNGDIGNGHNHNEPNGVRTDSPRDSNQNKSSSKDNNLKDTDINPKQETSFDSAPASPDSLSSEDIFVPINDEESKLNGTADSDMSQPLMNGDQNTDSDFLSPSREYIPVYSPDMGRVRIKMAEIPKPKTPVLVTRSRSNAGDIIITPSEDATRTTT